MNGFGPTLGETTDPADLILGSPDALRADAVVVDQVAEAIWRAVGDSRACDRSSFQGQGADAFWEALEETEARAETAVQWLSGVAASLNDLAWVIEQAQLDAGDLIRQWADEVETIAALKRVNPATDYVSFDFSYGGWLSVRQRRLLQEVEDLQASVTAVGSATGNVLYEAAQAAPRDEGFWNDVGYQVSQFGRGAILDPVVGTATFAYQYGLRFWWDPVDVTRDRIELITGMYEMARDDPGLFAMTMFGLDTWDERPAYTIGGLATNLALAAYTGGTVTAAIRAGETGATVSTRAAIRAAAVAGARNLAENIALTSTRRALNNAVSGFFARRAPLIAGRAVWDDAAGWGSVAGWVLTRVDPMHSPSPGVPGEWERLADNADAFLDAKYGRPVADHGHAPMPANPGTGTSGFDLVADPDAPFGRHPNGTPLTNAEYDARYVQPNGWNRYPPNDGAVRGTRTGYSDMEAFIRDYGRTLDRIGEPYGRYMGLAPEGISATFEQRSLPISALNEQLYKYDFTGNLPDGWTVDISEIAPGFGRDGGGVQVLVHNEVGEVVKVETLLKTGVIAPRS